MEMVGWVSERTMGSLDSGVKLETRNQKGKRHAPGTPLTATPTPPVYSSAARQTFAGNLSPKSNAEVPFKTGFGSLSFCRLPPPSAGGQPQPPRESPSLISMACVFQVPD